MTAVIDSSAIVAVLMDEPGHASVRRVIENRPDWLISAATYVEVGTVLSNPKRFGSDGPETLDRFLSAMTITVAPVDEQQARVALDVRIRYGKNFGHPAKLNYGDCFAYALAKVRNAPLLFVGDDFSKTDITSALA